MDWLKDVYEKFGNCEDLKSLRDNHFTGSIKLNFCNGAVNTCEKFAKHIITISVSQTNQTFNAVTIINENLFV